jgi:hypothetical protein
MWYLVKDQADLHLQEIIVPEHNQQRIIKVLIEENTVIHQMNPVLTLMMTMIGM